MQREMEQEKQWRHGRKFFHYQNNDAFVWCVPNSLLALVCLLHGLSFVVNTNMMSVPTALVEEDFSMCV